MAIILLGPRPLLYAGVALLVGTAVFPTTAVANIGLPIIILELHQLIWGFLPIVILETWLVRSTLRCKVWPVAKGVLLANLFSTAVGIPVAAIVHLFAGSVIEKPLADALGTESLVQRPFAYIMARAVWMDPGVPEWMIPAGLVMLLFIAFVVSWISESFVLSKLLRNVSPQKVWHAALFANAYTYLLMAIPAVMQLLQSIGWILEPKI